IPPHDYFVLTARGPEFGDHYFNERSFSQYFNGYINPEMIYNLSWSTGSRLANGGGTLYFALPNSVDPLVTGDVDPVFTQEYFGTANHPSLELTEPNYDPHDLGNWNLSILKGGSPQNKN